MLDRAYYCYIVASKTWVLYTGVTGNLRKRVFRHKAKKYEGFASKYNCDRLVWCEIFDDPGDAIAREKQLKGWRRSKKLAVIQNENPRLADLAADWFDPQEIEEWRVRYQEEREEKKRMSS